MDDRGARGIRCESIVDAIEDATDWRRETTRVSVDAGARAVRDDVRGGRRRARGRSGGEIARALGGVRWTREIERRSSLGRETTC